MSQLDWMKDESLTDIEQNKLDFLQKLFYESNILTEKERLPFFLAIATRAKKEHIHFTEDEVTRIIDVLKRQSTPKEIQKMDQVLRMFKEKKA
ncbi:MAG: hypothetical protein PHS74_01245 [Lachnospiraceae bacterium]|nr:hypothetical protein [Lachnospiraceae bacterium]